MKDIGESAREWGVETGYHDVFGTWKTVSDTSLHKIVAALSNSATVSVQYDGIEQNGLRVYQGDGTRQWALAVQLYAVRSARNWGIGDFGDLAEIVRVAATAGAGAVGLNPLHALFTDRPGDCSPYAPNSRLFLNALYLDVEALDEFRDGDVATGAREALRDSKLVDYAGVAGLKLAALRKAYDRFRASGSTARRDDFERFRTEQGDTLTRFACFEVLRARHRPRPWTEWPAPWRNPDAAAVQAFRKDEDADCGFHEYLQWNADRQLARCRDLAAERGMAIGLYLDLAVGVHPDGADAWSDQSAVLQELSVGAPGDAFNPDGQNWGLAPFNPHALPKDDFAGFRRLMGAVMRHAGAVRLDHVLGLMRLFLIPRHGGDGTYVRYPFEALLRVIAEESNRHHCIFIGEDLGTVPEGFRETAARWGVWSYRVVIFERWDNGEFKQPQAYPVEALATFNTHDLPTFRGWMTSHDLDVKSRLGIDPGENHDSRGHSRHMLQGALAPFGERADDFATAAAFLAATPSRLVSASIEDLLDVADQVNIPGTVDEHPNWRQKLPVPVEVWRATPTFARVAETFARNGRGNPR